LLIISSLTSHFSLLNIYFIFGLEISEAIYPKNIAAAIPAAEAFIPPEKAPIIPELDISSFTPFAKL